MAYGLRVSDSAGVIQLDIADRITRVMGFVDTGTANGSFVLPALANSDGAYFYFIMDGSNTPWFGNMFGPTVTLSGSTLSWVFPNVSASSRKITRIIFGAY